MTNDGLFNFGANPLFNPSFKLDFEYKGEIDDWIQPALLEQVKSFVKYAVDVLDINSLWSKYKKLLVIFEETESEDLDGSSTDNDQQGVIKIFLYDIVSDVRKLLTTVAHEMIHIRQFCDKRLEKLFKKVNGQVVSSFSWSATGELYYGEDNMESYRNLPWEIEAFGLQDELVVAYESGVALTK
jgi:hypothetical protein